MADNILNYLIKATWQGGGDTRRAKDDIAEIGKSSVTARNGLLELQAGLDIAGQALQVTGQVAAEFYDALQEGAELEATREKFDALAGSIGATGDVLLTDMRQATDGMVTDAQLVSGAAELMNLGLTKTAEETVRWSRAVSTLNLDMQVLGLTLANDSTMRLDSLGLSLERVNELTEEFKRRGQEASQAFDSAVLVALEEKMELFGDASETTAGKLLIIENKWNNLTDSIKLSLVEAWEPWIDLVSGEFANTVREIEQRNLDAAIATDDWTAAKYRTVEAENEIIAAAARTSNSVEMFTRKLREAGVHMFDDRTTRVWYDVERAIYEAEGAAGDFNDKISRQEMLVGNTATAVAELSAEMGEGAAASAYDDFNRRLEYSIGLHEDAAAAQAAHTEQVALARAEFTTTTEVLDSYATIVADGYGAAALAAEDSLERQAAANVAISQSYRETAVDILEARLAETIESDGLAAAGAMIAYQEALGLITPQEADKLQEIAGKTALIRDTTSEMLDVYLEDGVLTQQEIDNLAAAIDLIEESSNDSETAIIALAENGVTSMADLNDATTTTAGVIGQAYDRVLELKGSLETLPTNIDIGINLNVNGSLPNIPGSDIQPRAGGGPVASGQVYLVGERGPELFVPQQSGQVIPNHQLGETQITNHFHIAGSNAEQIAREVGVILGRQARLSAVARA